MSAEAQPRYIERGELPKRDLGRRHNLSGSKTFDFGEEDQTEMDYWGYSTPDTSPDTAPTPGMHGGSTTESTDDAMTEPHAEQARIRQLHDLSAAERARVIGSTVYATYSSPVPAQGQTVDAH